MNIFPLGYGPDGVTPCPVASALELPNTHTSKMCLEGAQLLSNAFPSAPVAIDDDTSKLPESIAGYRYSHTNHPCSLWVRETLGNFLWLCDHVQALAYEHARRMGVTRLHESYYVGEWCRRNYMRASLRSFSRETTSFALAMPARLKLDSMHRSGDKASMIRTYIDSTYADPVRLYRDYFRICKRTDRSGKPFEWYAYDTGGERRERWTSKERKGQEKLTWVPEWYKHTYAERLSTTIGSCVDYDKVSRYCSHNGPTLDGSPLTRVELSFTMHYLDKFLPVLLREALPVVLEAEEHIQEDEFTKFMSDMHANRRLLDVWRSRAERSMV